MLIESLQDFFNIIDNNKLVAALDIGTKKTGFAISDRNHIIAMPLLNIFHKTNKELIDKIDDLIKKYKLGALVIGLPLSEEGKQSSQSLVVYEISNKIAKQLNIPIYLQDERFTSKLASKIMKKDKNKNIYNDMIAASLILETSLSRLQRIKKSDQVNS